LGGGRRGTSSRTKETTEKLNERGKGKNELKEKKLRSGLEKVPAARREGGKTLPEKGLRKGLK